MRGKTLKTSGETPKFATPRVLRRAMTAALAVATLAIGGCTHLHMMLHGSNVQPPPESEFGLGPRVSANGLFEATLEPVEPLRVRRLQTVILRVQGPAASAGIDDAVITVDGGMPQHGHGLPTQPRVTQALGDGAYRVDGVRFNMGGWWELKFRIESSAGTDSVTFNLRL